MGRRGQTAAAAGVKLSYEEDEEVIVLSGDD